MQGEGGIAALSLKGARVKRHCPKCDRATEHIFDWWQAARRYSALWLTGDENLSPWTCRNCGSQIDTREALPNSESKKDFCTHCQQFVTTIEASGCLDIFLCAVTCGVWLLVMLSRDRLCPICKQSRFITKHVE